MPSGEGNVHGEGECPFFENLQHKNWLSPCRSREGSPRGVTRSVTLHGGLHDSKKDSANGGGGGGLVDMKRENVGMGIRRRSRRNLDACRGAAFVQESYLGAESYPCQKEV